MEKNGRERGVSPTESELEAMPTLLKGSDERKGGGKWRIVDGPALDDERKAYPLEWVLINAAPAIVNSKRLGELDTIGLG